jgi:hypothetical protein
VLPLFPTDLFPVFVTGLFVRRLLRCFRTLTCRCNYLGRVWLSDKFRGLGRFTYKRPITTILGVLMLAGILIGVGLPMLKTENDANKLWVPKDSEVLKDSDMVDDTWGKAPGAESLVITAKSGGDLINKNCLLEALTLHNAIANTASNGKRLGQLVFKHFRSAVPLSAQVRCFSPQFIGFFSDTFFPVVWMILQTIIATRLMTFTAFRTLCWPTGTTTGAASSEQTCVQFSTPLHPFCCTLTFRLDSPLTLLIFCVLCTSEPRLTKALCTHLSTTIPPRTEKNSQIENRRIQKLLCQHFHVIRISRNANRSCQLTMSTAALQA